MNADKTADCGDVPDCLIPKCTKCTVHQYWACACGASPMWDPSQPGGKPRKCKNEFCSKGPSEFRLTSHTHCANRFNHHIGSTCEHCGLKD